MRSASLLLVSIVTFTSVVAACGSDDDSGDAGPTSSSGSGSGASSSSSSSSASSSSSSSSSSSASSGGSGGAGAAGGGGSGGVADGGAGGAGGSLGGAGGSEGGAGGAGGATFCVPSATQACYSGPGGTQDVGVCKGGLQTCLPDGSAYGACVGEVLPIAESCATPTDENCNGQADEGCVVTYSGAVQAILQAKCSPCHNGGGSGNHNIAQSYAETQKLSVVCPGLTIGACALVRIQNGSMPFSAGCTGNPVLDAAKPACLTAAQQQTIQQWISGGQQP